MESRKPTYPISIYKLPAKVKTWNFALRFEICTFLDFQNFQCNFPLFFHLTKLRYLLGVPSDICVTILLKGLEGLDVAMRSNESGVSYFSRPSNNREGPREEDDSVFLESWSPLWRNSRMENWMILANWFKNWSSLASLLSFLLGVSFPNQCHHSVKGVCDFFRFGGASAIWPFHSRNVAPNCNLRNSFSGCWEIRWFHGFRIS